MARSQDFLIRIIGDASKGIGEIDKFSKKAEDLTALGRTGMIMGGLIAAGVGLAVARFTEFDAAMSNVVATGDDAAASQDALRQAALDAGASTVFSATESANAIEELAKAGVYAADTLDGGLNASLDLAAAGGLGVADAASIMATSMNQFAIEGRGASHVADLLAAGAGKAQGDVTDMSQALAQAGLVANATGLTIEETTGGLAAFASAGLLGSDAGTSFKSMLQRLTPQSAEAQSEMDRLGISAYDAGGNFIGLADFAGNLHGALQSLTPEQRQSALATIFGSDAVRAATILYNQGAEGIETWTDAVDDQGYAAQVARTRLDNLKGDVEALGGAFDSALIDAGSGANDGLRALTQTATGAVSVFSELPDPVQQGAIFFGIAAAAVGIFGGAALVGIPKIVALKAAIEGTSRSVGGLSLAAGAVTVGLTAAIAIVSAMATEQAEARAQAQSYADTLEAGTNRITKATREVAKEALTAKNSFLWMERDSAADAAEKLGISLDLVTDAMTGNVDQMKELRTQAEAAVRGNTALGDAYATLDEAVRGQNESLDAAIRIQEQKQEADSASVESSESAAGAYLEAADSAEQLTDQVSELIDEINKANGIGQDAVSTNANYRAALAGISEEVNQQKKAFEEANGTLDGFTLSLDEATVSGSANASSLADVAGRAQDAALAQFELDQKTLGAKEASDKYAGTLAAQRQAFIDSATEAGYNADEVQKLADKVFALPSQTQLDFIANTAVANQNLADLADRINNLPNQKRIGIVLTMPNGSQVSDMQLANQLGIGGHATGGWVSGPGTGTSDSILAWLSDGEFVVKESAARQHGGVLNWINNGGSLPGYAGGGSVGLAEASGPRPPMLALVRGGGGFDPIGSRTSSTTGRGSGGGAIATSTRLHPDDIEAISRGIAAAIYPAIKTGSAGMIKAAF